MVFDGQGGPVFGNVKAVMGKNQMLCDEMKVLLTDRLSFSDSNANVKPRLQQVHCRGSVEFVSKEYQQTKLSEIRAWPVCGILFELCNRCDRGNWSWRDLALAARSSKP